MINTFPFSVLSKPDVRTPQDLRGKKIVISRYGSSSDTAVRAAVEKYDLRPDKDVIILQGAGKASASRHFERARWTPLSSARHSI